MYNILKYIWIKCADNIFLICRDYLFSIIYDKIMSIASSYSLYPSIKIAIFDNTKADNP